MFRRFWMLQGVALVVALAVGVSRPVRADNPTEACTLLTQSQVSAALGAQVEAGGGLVPHICGWHVAGTPKGVSLILYSFKRYDALKQLAASEPPKVSLDGVGDEATFGEVPGFATTLLVRKGTIVFMVRIEGPPDGSPLSRETEETAKSLAREVLEKL